MKIKFVKNILFIAGAIITLTSHSVTGAIQNYEHKVLIDYSSIGQAIEPSQDHDPLDDILDKAKAKVEALQELLPGYAGEPLLEYLTAHPEALNDPEIMGILLPGFKIGGNLFMYLFKHPKALALDKILDRISPTPTENIDIEDMMEMDSLPGMPSLPPVETASLVWTPNVNNIKHAASVTDDGKLLFLGERSDNWAFTSNRFKGAPFFYKIGLYDYKSNGEVFTIDAPRYDKKPSKKESLFAFRKTPVYRILKAVTFKKGKGLKAKKVPSWHHWVRTYAPGHSRKSACERHEWQSKCIAFPGIFTVPVSSFSNLEDSPIYWDCKSWGTHFPESFPVFDRKTIGKIRALNATWSLTNWDFDTLAMDANMTKKKINNEDVEWYEWGTQNHLKHTVLNILGGKICFQEGWQPYDVKYIAPTDTLPIVNRFDYILKHKQVTSVTTGNNETKAATIFLKGRDREIPDYRESIYSLDYGSADGVVDEIKDVEKKSKEIPEVDELLEPCSKTL